MSISVNFGNNFNLGRPYDPKHKFRAGNYITGIANHDTNIYRVESNVLSQYDGRWYCFTQIVAITPSAYQFIDDQQHLYRLATSEEIKKAKTDRDIALNGTHWSNGLYTFCGLDIATPWLKLAIEVPTCPTCLVIAEQQK